MPRRNRKKPRRIRVITEPDPPAQPWAQADATPLRDIHDTIRRSRASQP